ncbi:MAG TPA: amino acid permease [Vicinamibacterales bacterium]|nr:amino acid permease [Vicinamibacterales bacterium]
MPPAHTTTLERRLGPYDAAAIIVSNVIGSGIFLTPAIIAGMVPDPIWMLAVWAAGGLLAFAGAMAYAELAALRPHAGGEYVYLREAFGPLAAYLTGWTSFVAGFSGAIAASSVGLAVYLGRFLPAAADARPLASLSLGFVTLTVSRQSLVAIAAIMLLSLVHLRGVGHGRLMQNVLATLKVTALVVLIAAGLSLGDGSMEHLSGGAPVAPTSWLLALVPVMFSYSGWNAAAYVAEEIRNPGRFVPRALGLGTGAVIAIYLLLNLLFLYSIPVGELAQLKGSVIDVIADRLFGAAAGSLMAIVTIISIAASVSAMVFAGPRVYYAMARDGLFFAPAARVHQRYKTPAWSILAQAVWSALLVLSGGFVQLLEYTGFAVILFAGIAGVALFVLRRRAPEARPFLAWGYPYAPAIFVGASALIVLNAIWRNPGPSGAGLAIILAGLPLYALLRRRR